MSKNAGRKWPIIIGLSIVGVVLMSVATVKIAINNPVEMSDYGMQGYHEYDANANDIINAKIAFDQKYSIQFLTPQITQKGTILSFELKDKEGHSVNDAAMEVVLTRPDNKESDINLTAPTIDNGKYTFNSVDLPKEGRWDILAKIVIGKDQRYYNLKADTRYPNTFEF